MTLLVALLAGLAFLAKSRLERERSTFLGKTTATVAQKAATILQSVEKRYQQDVRRKPDGEAEHEAKRLLGTIPADANYLYAVRAHLQRRYRELEDNLGLSKDIAPIESALKVWKEIYEALGKVPREELGWFRINSMSVSQSEAAFVIEVADVAVSDKVRRALNANEYLRKRAADPSSPVAPGSSQSNPQTNRTTVRLSVKFVDDAR